MALWRPGLPRAPARRTWREDVLTLSRQRLALAALVALAMNAAACGGAAAGLGRRAAGGPASAPAPSASTGTPATAAAASAAAAPTGAAASAAAASARDGAPASGRPSAAPVTWTALGAFRPLWIARSRPGLVSDPAHPQDMAYCAPGAVELSHDRGRSWTALPTAGVVAATAGTRFPVEERGGGSAPPCTAALADPAHPETAYAVFDAGDARYGMPPVYHVPLVTDDGGRRWSVVAPPAGFTAGGFGGFEAGGGAVRALFGRSAAATGAAPGPPLGVVETADGGATWHGGSLACPPAGPCLAWGPAASGTGSCAMRAYPQAVEASADGGGTWTPLAPPAASPLPMLANGCSLNQLAALSAARVALVANGGASPRDALRISDDGGRTWTRVALPAPPGSGAGSPALQMLPDGSLLAPVFVPTGPGRFAFRLDLLRPGAAAWCTVPGVTLRGADTDAATLQAAGGRLWWIEGGGPSVAGPKSVPLSAVRC